MNLTGIVSVSGMPGLYKVVAQTKNGLVAEALVDGKRLPIFSNDKVSSLEDISIYGNSADIPLKDVLGMIKEKLGASGIPSAKEDPKVMRAAFASCVTDFADDRVYTSDIKKVFVWYALLDAKGLLDAEPEEANEVKEENTTDNTFIIKLIINRIIQLWNRSKFNFCSLCNLITRDQLVW
jgi:hypothetical protein